MNIHVTLPPGRLARDLARPRRDPDRDRAGCAAPGPGQIDRLYRRLSEPDLPPRTRALLDGSRGKKVRKLVEEAAEVALDAQAGDVDGVIRESADLLYHLAVVWHDAGIDPHEVWTEMARRAWRLGIAEKLPKKTRPRAAPTNHRSARPGDPS